MELRQQVNSFWTVARSLSLLRNMNGTDLARAFVAIKEMQGDRISPSAIELCSLHLRGISSSPLPFCFYESVPYRYAHEAFRLTLAQRGVSPHVWFRFFALNHETIVNNCMAEARRFSSKRSVEAFTNLNEWRRLLPVILSTAVKALSASFAGLNKNKL